MSVSEEVSDPSTTDSQQHALSLNIYETDILNCAVTLMTVPDVTTNKVTHSPVMGNHVIFKSVICA